MPVTAKFRAAQKSAAAAKRSGRRYSKAVIPRSLPQSINRQVVAAMARNTEFKYVDWNNSPASSSFTIDANLGTNTTIFCINPMQEGAGFFNRIGRKTKIMSFRIKTDITHLYNLNLAVAPPVVIGNQLRMVLVYDREPRGVIPTFQQIFAHTDNVGVTTTDFSSSLHLTQADRFRILLDRVVDFDLKAGVTSTDFDAITGATQTGSTYLNYHHIDHYLDVSKRDITQMYTSTTNPATISNLSTGAVYLVLKARQDVATTRLTWQEGSVRIKVMDN